MAQSSRVILVGEYGVGKTSLFRRFRDGLFDDEGSPLSTIGCDTTTKSFLIGNRKIQLELWDTGGMERVSSMNLSYFRGANAAVICYSPMQRVSFDLISDYIIQVEQLSNPNCRMFICATKWDLYDDDASNDSSRRKQCVSSDEITDFEMECSDMLAGSFKTSSKSNLGVDEMFESIAKKLNDTRPSLTLDRIKLHETVTTAEFNHIALTIIPYQFTGECELHNLAAIDMDHSQPINSDSLADDQTVDKASKPPDISTSSKTTKCCKCRTRYPSHIHRKAKSNCCR
ncbi:ras-related protein Rab-24-like [Tubulanus polymorphus]|uniref:ras-related protein Rab-24-like n=1 Tax=Tubulanus polymorphus TaxID=672921 RepID=UPI003DA68FED